MKDQNETTKIEPIMDTFGLAKLIPSEPVTDPSLVLIDEWASKILRISQSLESHYYVLRSLKKQIETEMSMLEEKQQSLKSVYDSMFSYYCETKNKERSQQ